MFDIKNGVISLNKTKKLSPKQMSQLKRIHHENDRNRYIMSIMGLTKRERLPITRLKASGYDPLVGKGKGSIARLMRRIKDVSIEHRPTNKDVGQWVGVEIECIIPNSRHFRNSSDECNCEYDDDGDRTYECDSCSGDPCDNGAHNWLRDKLSDAGVSRVEVKSDGSLHCDDGGIGVEVTIVFNSAYGFEPLHKLCDALKDAGCYVNKTCGLHVHLDARHLRISQVKRIGHSLGHSLPVIKYLVDESRHDNSYCAMTVSSMRPNASRYHAINLQAFTRFKTIEVRLHGGSINPIKITHWINLLKLIGTAKLKSPLRTFQELIDLPGVTESMIEYMEKRINRLHPDAWPKIMPIELVSSTPIVPMNISPDDFETLVSNALAVNQARGA